MIIRRFKGDRILNLKKVGREEIMELIMERVENKKVISKSEKVVKFSKPKDTFEEMIRAGEAFKKALGISDEEIYDLLKKRG